MIKNYAKLRGKHKVTKKDAVYNTKLAKEHFKIGVLYYNRSNEKGNVKNNLKSACFHFKEAALLGCEKALNKYIKIKVSLDYPHLCADDHLSFVKEGCADLFNSFCEDELKAFKQEQGEIK